MRTPRPSIFQVGKVTEGATSIRIHGWGLGLCAARCTCHRVNGTGALSIVEGTDGTLGLLSTPADGGICTCCEPWHAEELAAILRDIDVINGVTTVDKPTQKEEQP